MPFSLFGSVCLDIILLSKTPRENISTKRQSSVIKLSWNRDEVGGIDWLSLCLDAAVAWMSRTGYESIWLGWDHARGQGNQLVREVQAVIFSLRFSFFNAGDLRHWMKKLSPARSSSSWTLVTWNDAAGVQHLQPSPSSGPMQGPEGTLCKKQSKPGDPPWFPRLLEQTGQDLILRDSYMAPLLKQLKSRKTLVKVMSVIPYSGSAPYSSLYFMLSILKELCLSLIRWRPLYHSKEASTADFETWCSVEKWRNRTMEINFCLSSLNSMICWPAKDVMKPIDSP